ncbi:hypothetical protein NRY95_05575 [Xanthomonas campestris pv. phormiicola]|nr:hypothetical protein [Xanthomonas campestris pv. phormiicola]UYC17434.1 hypothetical protein NRY95_05575 [Xanthomonas campestris pv. phormiicola]
MNRRWLLRMVVLVSALVVFEAAASENKAGTDIIQGMGDRVPAGKDNVSLSPQFKVYTFEKDGLKFVQINSLDDEVLTVISVTPGAVSRLPIGSAANEPLVVVP